MAIGITMYNEKTPEFERTFRGIVQGLVDIFNDEVNQCIRKANSQESWDEFTDEFCVVLLADGYKNIDPGFLKYAKDEGYFDETLIN